MWLYSLFCSTFFNQLFFVSFLLVSLLPLFYNLQAPADLRDYLTLLITIQIYRWVSSPHPHEFVPTSIFLALMECISALSSRLSFLSSPDTLLSYFHPQWSAYCSFELITVSEGLYCRHALHFCLSSPGTLSAIRTTCLRKCTAPRDCLYFVSEFSRTFAASGVRQRILWFRDHLSVGRDICSVLLGMVHGTLNTWMVAEATRSLEFRSMKPD